MCLGWGILGGGIKLISPEENTNTSREVGENGSKEVEYSIEFIRNNRRDAETQRNTPCVSASLRLYSFNEELYSSDYLNLLSG